MLLNKNRIISFVILIVTSFTITISNQAQAQASTDELTIYCVFVNCRCGEDAFAYDETKSDFENSDLTYEITCGGNGNY
jgi:hypothetical protein